MSYLIDRTVHTGRLNRCAVAQKVYKALTGGRTVRMTNAFSGVVRHLMRAACGKHSAIKSILFIKNNAWTTSVFHSGMVSRLEVDIDPGEFRLTSAA